MNKHKLFFSGLLLQVFLFGQGVQAQPALMPWPAQLQVQPGQFVLPVDQPLSVQLKLTTPNQAEKNAHYLLAHFQQRLSAQAQRPLLLQPWPIAKADLLNSGQPPIVNSVNSGQPRNSPLHSVNSGQPPIVNSGQPRNSPLHNNSNKSGQPQINIEIEQLLQVPKPGDVEAYQLHIEAKGVHIKAATSTGALYALETLSQWLVCPSGTDAKTVPCYWPAVHISDQPRFGWRGLLLDSARRFIPIEVIKRQLQGMAAAKLNVLHWHLTDDQGWRFESLEFPQLQNKGSDGQFYTQAQMRELVQYAASLGIRIVPEIDLPGHASAIGLAYPELMAGRGVDAVQQPERRFGIFAPVLDVSSPAVLDFSARLLAEVAAIFPDPYLHIGGDEVKPDHWLANPDIQAYMQRQQLPDAQALHADFNQRLQQILQPLNRRMMGWDEVLHPALPKTVLVQSWQGQEAVAASVRAGHPTVLSAGFYLDQPMPTSFHYRNDPVTIAQPQPLAAVDWSKAQQLQFLLARYNQKAISGQIWLFPGTQPQARLWVEGRGVMAPHQVQWLPETDVWQFSIDNWLGPWQIKLTKAADGAWQTQSQIGNTFYPLQIIEAQPLTAATVSQMMPLQGALTPTEQAFILGGEAALWSELVLPERLDLKLWPRLFAVAERLWSPATVQDEQAMYQRLQLMDQYGQRIGLQHQAQQHAALRQIAGVAAADLQILAEVTEQAQYYTRHHLKTMRGQYHLDAPLDRLADALPAESLVLVKLLHQIQQLDCQNQEQRQALTGQFERWHQAAKRLQQYQGPQASVIQKLAMQMARNSEIALQWLTPKGKPLPPATIAQHHADLTQIKQSVDEEIMALAAAVRMLLQQCQGS